MTSLSEPRALPVTASELAVRLRALRVEAGNPSFTEITRRVGAIRSERGLPANEAHIGRVTVYDCFRENRKRLDTTLVLDIVEALGADKSEQLRWKTSLHAILQHANAASVVWVDEAIPREVTSFKGREQQIATIRENSQGAYWISGMPGVGKSQLAYRAARELAGMEHIHGVLTADLRGFSAEGPPVDPDAVVVAFLRALDVPPRQLPTTASARVSALLAALQERPHLLVLDDASDMAQVRRIVTTKPGSPVIVTSRSRPATRSRGDFTAIPLEAFTPEESLAVLRAEVGEGRIEKDLSAAHLLLDTTGHLPLAVKLLSSQVASRQNWPLGDIAEITHTRQRALRIDEAVADVFTLSYRALSADAQTMLRLLAVIPATYVDRRVAFALSADLVDDPGESLEVLSRHHLITGSTSDLFTIHQLLRLHATDISIDEDPPVWRRDARLRLVQVLETRAWTAYHAATVAGGEVPRVSRHGEKLEQETDETDVDFFPRFAELILSIVHGGEIDADNPEAIIAFSETLGSWLHRVERYDEAITLHTKALELAEQLDDVDGQVRALTDLGMRLATLGRFDKAEQYLRRALPRAEDHPREAVSIYNVLGVVVDRSGEMEEAADLYRRSIEYAEAQGDWRRSAHGWSNLAGVHLRTSQLDECEVALAKSVELAQQIGDDIGAARGQANLASLKLQRGEYRETAVIAEEAVKRFEALGIRGGVVFSSSNVGAALLFDERPEEAIPWLEKGLSLCADGSLPQHATLLHSRLAMCYKSLGDLENATAEAEEGLRIADEVGEMHAKITALCALAETRLEAEDPQRAKEYWQEALGICESTGANAAIKEIQDHLDRLPG